MAEVMRAQECHSLAWTNGFLGPGPSSLGPSDGLRAQGSGPRAQVNHIPASTNVFLGPGPSTLGPV